MKAIILKQPGSVENLEISEVAVPTIGSDEVLVEVKAVSINPVDAVVRSNAEFQKFVLGTDPSKETVILGWDISGVITETGMAVTRFKKGDEVFGMVNFTGHGKAYAEYVAAPESHLALKPANVSHAEAAAATLTALTAWQSLVTYGKIKAGDKVLIHSAAGGVGHLAVQIAKALGAYVIGTGSAENVGFIKSLGADEVIDYKEQPFESVINDPAVVVDGVAFNTDHLFRSMKALRTGGHLISLVAGFDNDVIKTLAEKDLTGHRLSVVSSGPDMGRIAELLEKGQLKPHIAQVFGFGEVSTAHLQVETGKTRGKIILDPAL